MLLAGGNNWGSMPVAFMRGPPTTEITQSSIDYGGPPELAYDGNRDGIAGNGSVTHAALENQPWWKANLGAVTMVTAVDVFNRLDCCQDRLSNFDVEIWKDNVIWTTVHIPGQGGSPTHVVFNAEAQYVRVKLRGTNYLSLPEVDIWGP